MFRGAIILGIGFSLGYATGLSNSQEFNELCRTVITELKKFNDEVQKRDDERKSEKNTTIVDAEAVETSDAQ